MRWRLVLGAVAATAALAMSAHAQQARAGAAPAPAPAGTPQAPAAAAPAGRAAAQLRCESFGMGPQLECTVSLQAAGGAPLADARLTLAAHMPSMPMAHSVKPVPAKPTGKPGEYRGLLELEMTGVWAVQIDLAASPGVQRDRTVHTLRIEDCPDHKRCAVAPANAASRGAPPKR